MIRITSHIVMSALLLFTATGMTINLHFCQDHLYDIALNAPAHDCCEGSSHDYVCHHHDQDQGSSHQCDNEKISIKGADDFLASGSSFDFEDSHSSDLFYTLFPVENPNAATSAAVRIIYRTKPPPREVVLSEIQSFLI
jgi:hypothetical protein